MRTIGTVFLVALALLVGVGQRALGQGSSALTEGRWLASFYEQGDATRYTLALTPDGKMRLSASGEFDVRLMYKGTYTKQGGVYSFKVKDEAFGGKETIEGRFTAKASGGKLRFTLVSISKDDLPARFKDPGVDFYKEKGAITVQLPAKPNVMDFFKAAYPLTFNNLIASAYNFIVMQERGCEEVAGFSSETKTVDYVNGFIGYSGCEAPPPRMEVCYWNCKDGTKLLAINVLNAGMEHPPTHELYFIRFDLSKKTMQEVERPLALRQPYGYWSLELPRKGKDIKLVQLDDQGKMESSRVVKWNGNGF